MSRRNRNSKSSPSRANLCDDITNKIIAELETGCVPWDERPPITIIPNRLPARLIDPQNVLFAALEWLLVARMEGAIASETCDVGLETLRADKRIGERGLA
jgi:hypothetical protein